MEEQKGQTEKAKEQLREMQQKEQVLHTYVDDIKRKNEQLKN